MRKLADKILSKERHLSSRGGGEKGARGGRSAEAVPGGNAGRGIEGRGFAPTKRERRKEGCHRASDLGEHVGEDELDRGGTIDAELIQREPATATLAAGTAQAAYSFDPVGETVMILSLTPLFRGGG